MNEYEKTLLDLQLDQACLLLKSLIQSGKTLPDYDLLWKRFTQQTMQQKMRGTKGKI